jgi:hypothetical protein
MHFRENPGTSRMDLIAETRSVLISSQQFVGSIVKALIHEILIARMSIAYSLGSLVGSCA